mgnify:CR=1 FL=1
MGIQLNLFKERKKKWKDGLESSSNRAFNFNTLSDEPLDTCYFPKDPESEYLEKNGFPGQFPFPRGIH